ncbi:MAG: DUF6440 family protein [Candidatus Hodarchaeales archaeon]
MFKLIIFVPILLFSISCNAGLVYQGSISKNHAVMKDLKTGCHYIYYNERPAWGLTVYLDRNGKPYCDGLVNYPPLGKPKMGINFGKEGLYYD